MSEVLWTELEKVDVLRQRMGVTYEQARQALEYAQGDLIKALAHLENEQNNGEDGLSGRFLEGLKDEIKRLNQTQLNLKHQGKTVFSVSAPLGIAMAYTIWRRPSLRMLGLLGAAMAVMKHYELEVATQADLEEEYDEYPYDIKAVIVPDEELKDGEAEVSE